MISKGEIVYGHITGLILVLIAVAAVVPTNVSAQSDQPATEVTLVTAADTAGYMVGWQFGQTIITEEASLNVPLLKRGVADALTLNSPLMTQGEVGLLILRVRQKVEALVEQEELPDDIPTMLYGTRKKRDFESLETTNDSLSYAIGFNFGQDLRAQKANATARSVVAAITDAVDGRESKLSEDDLLQIMVKRQIERESAESSREAMRMSDEEYMMENIERPEVNMLPGGVQFLVVAEGTGPTIGMEEVAVIQAVVRTVDGELLYDSHDSPRPIGVDVANATETMISLLTQMKVGSTWRLFVPPDVSFGRNLVSNQGDNRALQFDIELLGTNTVTEEQPK